MVIYLFIFFAEALSRLNAVIQHPNALQSDNLMAYDNAVSALGKICQFHRDGIDSAQVLVDLYSFISIVVWISLKFFWRYWWIEFKIDPYLPHN